MEGFQEDRAVITSHLTEPELKALDESKLSRATPFMITGVSNSQFSIARHYGGLTFNGSEYVYVPPTDELIRADVVKWLTKRRKVKREVET